jgi:hypothetical protein
MAFKYGAAAHSAGDRALIYPGVDQARGGSYDLGVAYDERLAGRPRGCLRAAVG